MSTEKMQEPEKEEEEGWTRREFLKKAGLGAASLGALSIMPSASAINIRDSNGLKVFSNGNKHFDVQSGGPVKVNTMLEAPESTITGQQIHGANIIRKGRKISSGESLQIPSDQGATVEQEYTPNGTLTVDGDLHVTKHSSEIKHSSLKGTHPKSHLSLLAQEEITAVGGSTPAFDGTIPNISRDQTQPIDVIATPKNAENFPYAYNTSTSKQWNGGSWDIQITINWDQDPGSGNNVKMNLEVHRR